MENIITIDENSDECRRQSEARDLNVKPCHSHVTKSWGFRQSTIARREFLEEVGELAHCSTLARRPRGRRSNRTENNTADDPDATQGTFQNIINDLEWSAPSSPASDDGQPAPLASTGGGGGGGLDSLMWQDFGSAFDTAFSLLGGSDGLDMSDVLAGTNNFQANDFIEPHPPQAACDPEVVNAIDDIPDPIVLDDVTDQEVDNILSVYSQGEDSDEMTLMAIKERITRTDSSKPARGRGGKGGRGRAKGKGRGRGRGRGRARGRGKPAGMQPIVLDDSDDDEPNNIVDKPNQENNNCTPVSRELSPALSTSESNKTKQDCIIIDTDSDPVEESNTGQFDNAPEEADQKPLNSDGTLADSSIVAATDSFDCVCREKRGERFTICCDSCQKCLHGECVGITAAQSQIMKSEGKDYMCSSCTIKTQNQAPSFFQPQLQSDLSTSSPNDSEQLQAPLQSSVECTGVKKDEESPGETVKSGLQEEVEHDDSRPRCIGPECLKSALADSVYCGSDCILKHAAFAMKSLSGPKVPKARGRPKRKAEIKPPVPGQKSGRTSQRLAEIAVKELKNEEAEEQEAATSVCDRSLTDAQATAIPSSQFYTACDASDQESQPETEPRSSPKQTLEDNSTDSAEAAGQPVQTTTDPKCESKKPVEDVNQDPAAPEPKCQPGPLSDSSATKRHETGAVLISKTSYVIPKKPAAPPPSSHAAPTSASQQKPTSGVLLNEARNLLVPPAPSAPSSRPSQPNTQVRQSIQKTLSGILVKRVCDCEDLHISENDAAKLVANIESEMFDIFRNTDSKYMNKYRTIMFNLKDPRNRGLLYRLVRGEISPFRLVRMSQKDMQAVKEPEPQSTAETREPHSSVAKVDLSCLNSTKPDKRPGTEQKKKPPASDVKNRFVDSSKNVGSPDLLTCMLKDTTSEHKAHLFDLKCKICTGQLVPGDEEEPVKKKAKLSETKEPHYSRRPLSARGDSPLRAPPDLPDMDSPPLTIVEHPSRLVIDSPTLTIIESPASPVLESPASPVLESPASPLLESPASPNAECNPVQHRAYAPVVIPSFSTVSATQRDPRTAAARQIPPSIDPTPTSVFVPPSSRPPLNEAQRAPSAPSQQTPKLMPKSILMKPSTLTDPRFYATPSRNVLSESPADGDTSQFLAKQEVLWKGFINMLTVTKFVTKGYLVSGSAEPLKMDLPDTIQIGGRIMPHTVWDYVAKLKTSLTKELCVIRFHPGTEEEAVAYVSLFSYFSSRGRFGVVSNSGNSVKDIYLVPLSAKESIPSMLQPLEGPGLEKNRPNLLLGLAIVQKLKPNPAQEVEEKRPNVSISRDEMWIPKPPILYGSDKIDVFKPSAGSLGSSKDTVATPSVMPSDTTQSVALMAGPSSSADAAGKSVFNTLLRNKPADSLPPTDPRTTISAKIPASGVSTSMFDPIVQQYKAKSKGKEAEEGKDDFERPYDPEEEYDPAMGYVKEKSQSVDRNQLSEPHPAGSADDDVAYDPEDETLFETVANPLTSNLTRSTPASHNTEAGAVKSAPAPPSLQPAAVENLSTDTVVVSAATLTEQQRMLEELNRQIEQQKRQLKEQEEALRQQREAVGMFMAQFTASESVKSSSAQSLALSQLSCQQGGSKLESSSNDSSQTGKTDSQMNKGDSVPQEDEVQEGANEGDKYSSAGEIDDSDVAYDPEDETLLSEIQEQVFQDESFKSRDSSLSRTKSNSPTRHRKRRSSPKKRSHRPSKRSQCRSSSEHRKRRERSGHRKGERDRSKHRTRDQHHRKDRSTRHRSRGRGKSPSPPIKIETSFIDPPQHSELCPVEVHLGDDDKSSQMLLTIKNESDQNAPAQVIKPCPRDTFVHDKLESSIPLREIDPPTRDSPQSPDPEPQFTNPFSMEKLATITTVEVGHTEIQPGSSTTQVNANIKPDIDKAAFVEPWVDAKVGKNRPQCDTGSSEIPGESIAMKEERVSYPGVPTKVGERPKIGNHAGQVASSHFMNQNRRDFASTNASPEMRDRQRDGNGNPDLNVPGLNPREDFRCRPSGGTEPSKQEWGEFPCDWSTPDTGIQGKRSHNGRDFGLTRHEAKVPRFQEPVGYNETSRDFRGIVPEIPNCPISKDIRGPTSEGSRQLKMGFRPDSDSQSRICEDPVYNMAERSGRESNTERPEGVCFGHESELRVFDEFKGPVPGKRVHPDFRDLQPEKRGRPNSGGPEFWKRPDSDFIESGFVARSHPDSAEPGSCRRADENCRGPGPWNGGGPNIQQPDIQCQEGTDFRGHGSVNREGPRFRGPGLRNREGPDIQQPGVRDRDHIDFRGPGFGDREGPDFRGPSPRNKEGPDVQQAGIQGRGGPGFRGMDSENRDGPHFQGRSPMNQDGPDVIQPGIRCQDGPNFRDPDLGNRGRPDFSGLNLRNRDGRDSQSPGIPGRDAPDFQGPRFGNRQGPDFRGPSSRNREIEDIPHAGIRGRGRPHFSGPVSGNREGPDFRGTSSRNRQGPDVRQHSVQGCDGPDFRGPGSGGLAGPDFRGPNPRHNEGPNIQQPGVRDRDGPDYRGPGSREGLDFKGPSPRSRDGPDFQQPGIHGQGRPHSRGLVSGNREGPDFREHSPRNRESSHFQPSGNRDRENADFRGPGSGNREAPDFRGPSPRNIDGPERHPNDFRGPGIGGIQNKDFRGPEPTRGRSSSEQCEGLNFSDHVRGQRMPEPSGFSGRDPKRQLLDRDRPLTEGRGPRQTLDMDPCAEGLEPGARMEDRPAFGKNVFERPMMEDPTINRCRPSHVDQQTNDFDCNGREFECLRFKGVGQERGSLNSARRGRRYGVGPFNDEEFVPEQRDGSLGLQRHSSRQGWEEGEFVSNVQERSEQSSEPFRPHTNYRGFGPQRGNNRGRGRHPVHRGSGPESRNLDCETHWPDAEGQITEGQVDKFRHDDRGPNKEGRFEQNNEKNWGHPGNRGNRSSRGRFPGNMGHSRDEWKGIDNRGARPSHGHSDRFGAERFRVEGAFDPDSQGDCGAPRPDRRRQLGPQSKFRGNPQQQAAYLAHRAALLPTPKGPPCLPSHMVNRR